MDPRIKSLETTTFFGRRLTRRQIAGIQETVALFPDDSRNELAKTVCEHVNRHTPKGNAGCRPACARWSCSYEAPSSSPAALTAVTSRSAGDSVVSPRFRYRFSPVVKPPADRAVRGHGPEAAFRDLSHWSSPSGRGGGSAIRGCSRQNVAAARRAHRRRQAPIRFGARRMPAP